MPRTLWFLLTIFFAGSLSGCMASSNSYQTAQTLRPGGVTLAGALHATGIDGVCGRFNAASDSRNCLKFEGTDIVAEDHVVPPMPEVAARFGLAPRLDLGARVTLIGAEVDLKAQPVDTEHFDLALGLKGRAFFHGASMLEGGGAVPLFVTARPIDWLAFTGVVQANLSTWGDLKSFGVSSDNHLLAPGITAGGNVSIEVKDLFIRPEAMWNHYPTAIGAPPFAGDFDGTYVTFGIGAGARLR